MEENKTNYGKIIAITLAVIASAAAIGFVLARVLRSVIAFCNTYSAKDEELCCDDLDISELEEDAEAPTEEATEEAVAEEATEEAVAEESTEA